MEKIDIIHNQYINLDKVKDLYSLQNWDPKQISSFHDSIGNKQTPLVRLPGLAKHLGVGNILLKDESHRFGLNAFKALGASYAMHRQIEKNPQIKIFCTVILYLYSKKHRKKIIYIGINAVKTKILQKIYII